MAEGLSCAPIVGYSLQSFKEVEFGNGKKSGQNYHCGRNKYGGPMDWPEFHRGGTKQKTQSNSRLLWVELEIDFMAWSVKPDTPFHRRNFRLSQHGHCAVQRGLWRLR